MKTSDMPAVLFASIQDGILAYDRDCRYTYWNSAMEQLTDVPAKQLLGQLAFEVFPFLKDIGEDQYFYKSLKGEACVSALRPFNVPKTGKSGFFEGHYSPVRNPAGEIIGGMAIVRDVTERVRAEASDQMFQIIAESIPHIVWVSNIQMEVSYFNRHWYEYTGLDPKDSNASYMDYVHPDDRDHVMSVAVKSRDAGADFEAEYRLRNKKGEYRWFLGRGISVPAPAGGLLRRIGTATDIHDQKIAAQALHESNEKFRVLVEQSPFAFKIYSPAGDCLYANPAWETTWSAKVSELEGYNILKDPNAAALGVLDLIQRAFKGETIQLPEVFYDPRKVGKAGRAIWIRTYLFPIHNLKGELTQIAEVVVNVTDERYLREREIFLSKASKILGASLDPQQILSGIGQLCVSKIADFCLIDLIEADGTIRRVEVSVSDKNQQKLADGIKQCAPSVAFPDHPTIRALKSQKTVFVRDFDQSWIERATLSAQHRALMIASRPKSLVAIPLIARGQTFGVFTLLCSETGQRIFTDSEVEWLEELAERTASSVDNARLYLESKQAVIARDTFLAVASHELKTPLTTLQLQLSVTQRVTSGIADPVLRERIKVLLGQGDRQIRRLGHLVDDMLDISRIASGKLRVTTESMDLSSLAREVCDKLRGIAADYESQLSLTADRPVFGEWDGLRLEQVLNNLLINAFRYGGKTEVQVRVWEDEKHAYLSVKDTGRGIAKEDQERIFQRFERAISENDVSGYGIGLYIAREIVALHHGQIRVESELGKGSVFTVTLPKNAPGI